MPVTIADVVATLQASGVGRVYGTQMVWQPATRSGVQSLAETISGLAEA